jgi:hypothetical protein
MNGTRKGATLVACAVAVFALHGNASATTPHKRLQYGKGIGGIEIEMSRGRIDRLLNKPQEVIPLRSKRYSAFYRDEGLIITYRQENSKGKQDARRDRYDRAHGLQTISSQYTGRPSVGDPFRGKRCTPFDRDEGPDGGPPRVGACFRDGPKDKVAIIQMGAAASRPAQRVTLVGIYGAGFGAFVFETLMEEALERLDCETPACT